MIKLFEQYNQYNQVKDWLDKMEIVNYTINDDLIVDVNGDVRLSYSKLKEIPIQFGRVFGVFNLVYNELTSLKGCPVYVSGHFICGNNKLTSLEYCPEYIGGEFSCGENFLKNLIGGPKYVGEIYWCNNNQLTSLVGSPVEIDYHFRCENNKLTNLKYAPKIIRGSIFCNDNPSLPSEILDLNATQRKYFIDNQDEFGIWNDDGTFNKGRFELFKKEILD